MSFSNNLKRLRTERDMTQTELAAQAGIRESDVIRYERGNNMPRVETAVKLAAALGVTVDDLIGNPQPEPLKRVG
jgi:transcriptional regulator with XRE-family HTH domain